MWQKNIPFDNWDSSPYWLFEEVIKLMNERNKDENERQKKAEKEQTSRVPNMSNFNPSNFKTPNYNIPKY